MLNQLMSHTTNKKTNKKASTEHVKSGYLTHNKQKKTKKQQKGFKQEHAKSGYVTHNKQKTKKQTQKPQQNM